MTARPKGHYVRSDALREAYRLIPCQHCGAEDGTVVGAHANWSAFGKGMALKASDDRAASLCSLCHHQLDQGFLWDREQKRSIWEAAHKRTVARLVEMGLWPARVPLPEPL
jgi:hypothetical protein